MNSARRNRKLVFVSLLLMGLLDTCPALLLAQEVVWSRQFGTTEYETISNIAIDAWDNVFIVGYTGGTLPGQTSAGDYDAFVRKYDSSGGVVWTLQFGTAGTDGATDVAVDYRGDVFVLGVVNGAAGDVFLKKFTTHGTLLWNVSFTASESFSKVRMALDDIGNVYVAGGVRGALAGHASHGLTDVFLRQYSSSGVLMWSRQFGTIDEDSFGGVVTDREGNILISGTTSCSGTLWKYNSVGSELWASNVLNVGCRNVTGIGLDAVGNIYVSADEYESSHSVAAIYKFKPDGAYLWQRIPSTSYSYTNDFVVSPMGRNYTVGNINDFGGCTSSGPPNGFTTVINSEGLTSWTTTVGVGFRDEARAVAIDGKGHVYVAGATGGALPSYVNLGCYDAFLIKILDTPYEDTTPPDTVITSQIDGNSASVAAGASTRSTRMTFTFIGYDAYFLAGFECALDGGKFTSCNTPTTYNPLGAGTHTFRVRARDTAGNVDPTPAVFTWTVDLSPPETTITSALDGNGVNVNTGGSTVSTAITVTFAGTDNVGVSSMFDCRLDSASILTPCSTPKYFGSLAAGAHSLQVQAKDLAGNVDPSPATFNWTVLTPAQATLNLRSLVYSMSISSATKTALIATLDSALFVLTDAYPSNDRSACGPLSTFVSQVNTALLTGILTSSQALKLQQDAMAISGAIGC